MLGAFVVFLSLLCAYQDVHKCLPNCCSCEMRATYLLFHQLIGITIQTLTFWLLSGDTMLELQSSNGFINFYEVPKVENHRPNRTTLFQSSWCFLKNLHVYHLSIKHMKKMSEANQKENINRTTFFMLYIYFPNISDNLF